MIASRKRPTLLRIHPDNPFYPMSYKGYISPARLAMAQHLDRCLGSDEYIYYKDGDCFNYDISNLQLVSHKELTQLNQIRRLTKALERTESQLVYHTNLLAKIRFENTPCNCPKCTRSREARLASYSL